MNYGLHLSGVRIQSVEVAADAQHPNKMRFRGILVRLDEPSTKAPNGAQGHKILVSTEVAKRRLKTLIGMGLNYAPDLDGHAQRRKVGVIDKAWIDGKDLKVEGHVWKHDFPEAEKDLKQSGLGMSMELGDVRVDDPHADVWKLDDFQFLGATILWRDSAAYNRTQAIAARAEQRRGSDMSTKIKTKKNAVASRGERLAEIAAEAAAGAVRKGTRQLLAAFKDQTEVLGGIAARQEELSERVAALEEGKSLTAEVDGDEDDDIEAEGDGSQQAEGEGDEDEMETRKKVRAKGKKSKDEDEDEGGSASSGSSQEEDEMESSMDEGDLDEEEDLGGDDKSETPGHLNDDTKNHGSDTAGNKKVGKTVESARVRALRTANKELRRKLTQVQADASLRITKLEKKLEKIGTQVTAAAKDSGRKSVSPEIASLLAKANIDAGDLLRTKTKLTVAEVDSIFASSGVNLSSQDRMAWKAAAYREGLMEDGQVSRQAR